MFRSRMCARRRRPSLEIRMTKTTRLLGWWRLAETAVAGLAAPRIDVAASDRQADDLFRSSALSAAGRACGGIVDAAWRHSIARAMVDRFGREAMPPSGSQRVRAAAALTTIAVIVSVTLQLVTPGTLGPLDWALPVAVAACA